MDFKSLKDQFYYGHGKLLLTSEYFVMDGAEAIALPTNLGQSLSIKNTSSYQPTLHWQSFDAVGRKWFDGVFEFWHFNLLKGEENQHTKYLQKVLRKARRQNPHFLRDEQQVDVETRLGFPLEWGLGSSSSLLYNIAQWAYISPFELQRETFPGSGYDIACAQSYGPILFHNENQKATWREISFKPSFCDHLYFVYLGKKQNTQEGIRYYQQLKIENKQQLVKELSALTHEILNCNNLKYFDQLIFEHEKLISSNLLLTLAKDIYFKDFWGQVKSLGAWGGDFVLISSDKTPSETRDYFTSKGFDVFIPYRELISSALDQSDQYIQQTL